jgi:hypothetical protein
MINDNQLEQLLREAEMVSGGDLIRFKLPEIIKELRFLRRMALNSPYLDSFLAGVLSLTQWVDKLTAFYGKGENNDK